MKQSGHHAVCRWLWLACLSAPLVGRAQFPPPDSFNPGAVGAYSPFHGGYSASMVESIAVQPDGEILVGGQFATLAGLPSQDLGRVSASGGLDFGATAGGPVGGLLVQPDGRIVVGGFFSQLSGQPCTNIGRLNANGSLDATFTPQVNGAVYRLAAEPDGKILIAGDNGNFTSVGGQAVNHLARLTPDGVLDTQFQPQHGAFILQICCLAVQPDGKILIGGEVAVSGTPIATNLVRLNLDGSLDPAFQPAVTGSYSWPSINCIALQADGKILVGGYFSTLCGQTNANLGRLNADGTLDATFNAGTSEAVQALAVQANGKILVGGAFPGYLERLGPDGVTDYAFFPQITFTPPNPSLYFEPMVDALAVQPDGKILVGGVFSAVNGQTRMCIARLDGGEPVTNSLAYDGSTITWMRGGAGPEVLTASFDALVNGVWQPLGQGARIAGGWQLANATLLPYTTFRARGAVAGQAHEGSGCSYVETTTVTPPFIRLGLDWNQGAPMLSLTGETGRQYTVESVPALGPTNAWQPVSILTLTNNPQSVGDPAGAQAQRFYRARRSL